MKTFTLRLAALLLSLPLLAHAQAESAATVMLITGAASAESGGVSRALSKDSAVYSGDTLTVGANSYLNLLFKDGGRILLRPGTQFTVENFVQASRAPDPAPAPTPASADGVAPPAPAIAQSSGRAFFRLVRGGFRAISGLIGKGNRSEYQVVTPVATIGIRGTDYEALICEGDCPAEMLPPGEKAPNGLVVGVNEGGIEVSNAAGTYNVDVGQFALALSGGQLYVLPFQPMQLMTNPTPNPKNCQ